MDKFLQKKMPINNTLLKSASAIDPCLREHSQAVKLLKQLPKFMPNVIADTVQSQFEMEVHKYVVDPSLPYKALIGPYLEYATVVWNPCMKKNIFLIEKHTPKVLSSKTIDKLL